MSKNFDRNIPFKIDFNRRFLNNLKKEMRVVLSYIAVGNFYTGEF